MSSDLRGQISYPDPSLFLFLCLCCFTGTLKQWALVIYGTAEHPYPVRRLLARSAEMPMDSDLTEEYSGESRAQLVLSGPVLSADLSHRR